jgi:hypothetical protein
MKNVHMRLPRRTIFAVPLLGLAACATTTFVIQQYEGDALEASRVAVLRVNGGTDIVIVAFDGEELNYSQTDESSRVHIEMLPGMHEITVGNLADPLRRVNETEFLAEAGKVYRLTLDKPGGEALGDWRPLVWVVDADTDRTLSTAKTGDANAKSAASASNATAAPVVGEPRSAPATDAPPASAPTTTSTKDAASPPGSAGSATAAPTSVPAVAPTSAPAASPSVPESQP